MNKFTKSEIKNIIFIFLILFSVSIYNLLISQRRGRDSIRKNDISAVSKLLDTYLQKYKIYPLATSDGKIIGCFNGSPELDKISGHPTNAIVCEWGESKFESEINISRDPLYQKGSSYFYVSDGRKYKFYIALEGKDEAEYTELVVNQNLHCGNKICNYGVGN